MITNNGRMQHLSLLAGKAFSFADRFVLGASPVVMDRSATDLDFAWGAFPITDSIVDHELQQVVFYGTIPAEIAGQIEEIGLATIDEVVVASGKPINRTFFFGIEEGWAPAGEEEITYLTDGTKMGVESLHWEEIGAGQIILLQALGLDISDVGMIKSRVVADESTEIELSFFSNDVEKASKLVSLNAGENLIKFNREDLVRSEGFSSQNVVSIQIEVISGSGNLSLDGLILSNLNNGGLVMREIPANPITKTGGSTMEIEMAVMLNV